MGIEGDGLITKAVVKSRAVSAIIEKNIGGQTPRLRNAASRILLDNLKTLRQKFKPEVGPEDETLSGLSEKYPVSTTIKPEIREKVRDKLKEGRGLQHPLFGNFLSFADSAQAETACEYISIQAIKHGRWVALSPDSVREFVSPGTRAMRKLNMSSGRVIDQSPPPEENPQVDLGENLQPLFKRDLVRQIQDSDGLYWWAPTENLIQGIIQRVGIPQNTSTALQL